MSVQTFFLEFYKEYVGPYKYIANIKNVSRFKYNNIYIGLS